MTRIYADESDSRRTPSQLRAASFASFALFRGHSSPLALGSGSLNFAEHEESA